MRPIRKVQAVSSIIMIILILCSLVIGGLISYLWVMSEFYLEPNTVQLAITEANFPADHAGYFNITVMNPSNSPSAANITRIYFTAEGNNTTFDVSHSYPIQLDRASSTTIQCNQNWGELAGKSVTVYVLTSEGYGTHRTVQTPKVRLNLNLSFDASTSSKEFSINVENSAESAVNLTLTKITVNAQTVENTSATLPYNLSIGGSVPIKCYYDWENLADPVVRVDTAEEYSAQKSANATARLLLAISKVMFNQTDTGNLNITVVNAPASSTPINVSDITVEFGNGTTHHIDGSLTDPPFVPSYGLRPGETVTFKNCLWNWTSYRDQEITVNVFTSQGFQPASKPATTPAPTIFEISTVDFNITKTGYFTLNVTNAPISMHEINLSRIMFNSNITSFANQSIPIGEERQFNCTFDWADFRGETVTIMAENTEGFQELQYVTLPAVDLRISDVAVFDKESLGNPYINLTILNKEFSAKNITISQLTFTTANETLTINGTSNAKLAPNGYLLIIGSNVTLPCIWNWATHLNETLTVTVQAAEGFTATQTFQIPSSPP